MLKAVFRTQLIPADSLLTHSRAMLFRRGDWPQFVKTQLPLWVDWNHFSTQENVTDKTDLLSIGDKLSSAVYQWRRKERFVQEWKYPPDVINPRIINPILCLEATDWLHASVTHSNLRVSIRGGKKLKCLSGHGVRCWPWNIHNLRAEPQWRWRRRARIWLAESERFRPRWPISPMSCHSQIDFDVSFSPMESSVI